MPLDDSNVIAEESQVAEAKLYPGFLQASWLLVLHGIVVFFLMIPVGIMAGISDMPLHKDPLFTAIVSLGALTFVLYYGIEKSKTEFKQLFSFKAIRGSLLVPLVMTLIGLGIVTSIVNSFVVAIIPGGEEAAQKFVNFIQKDTYAVIVFTVMIAPIVEELMFRGLMLRGFLQRYKVKKAIMFSALFFAIGHGNAFQFIPALFAGILLAWWFVKTRSLVPCIFGHVFNNALIVFAVPLVGAYIPHYEESQFGPSWLYVVGVVLLALGIWLSVQLFRKHSVEVE